MNLKANGSDFADKIFGRRRRKRFLAGRLRATPPWHGLAGAMGATFAVGRLRRGIGGRPHSRPFAPSFPAEA